MILDLIMGMPEWMQTAFLTIEFLINAYALNDLM